MENGLHEEPNASRRAFLCRLLAVAPAMLLPALWSRAEASGDARTLAFRHTHTGETLRVVYRADGGYRPDALRQIDHLLRDFRTGDEHPIDPQLLDLLHEVACEAGSNGVFEVISGYRSPETNARLRSGSNGVAKGSLHMQGRAIDFRLTDVPTSTIRDTARALKRGGVGYYGKSDFVHLDTGRFRTW